MHLESAAIGFLASCLVPSLLHAQADFSVAGHEVQIHGYLSGGFATSTDNNYLTMDTSEGSFFMETGLNVSAKVTSRLRVGAQLYDRYMGELGKGRVYLDWAQADFRFKDWLGVRGGKIKTSLGLYTDTQDQMFLHTWVLLPQGVYPADLRSITVAHVGGDIYGNIIIPHAGSLSYTGFAGSIPADPRGGFLYGIQSSGGSITEDIAGRTAGIDLRWSTPIADLMVGTTWVHNHLSFAARFGASPVPLAYSSTQDHVTSVFADYARGNLHVNAEYRGQSRRADLTAQTPGATPRKSASEQPAWFTSAAYRLSRRVEVGGYYSHYHVGVLNSIAPPAGPGRDHIFDKVLTMRVDVARFWAVKVEGHFMDGVGSPGQTHGFYPQNNPGGLEVATTMLVLRTTVFF